MTPDEYAEINGGRRGPPHPPLDETTIADSPRGVQGLNQQLAALLQLPHGTDGATLELRAGHAPRLTAHYYCTKGLDTSVAMQQFALVPVNEMRPLLHGLESLLCAVVTRADSPELMRAIRRADEALRNASPGWTAPVDVPTLQPLGVVPHIPSPTENGE